jgi:hypothetical protein
MSDKYPKSKGSLFFNNERTADNQPFYRGHVLVTKAQVDQLIKMGQAGEEVKLQLAGWRKVAESGTKYIFLSTEAYRKEEESNDGWGDQGQQSQASGDGWEDDSQTQQDTSGGWDDDIPF